MNLSAFLTDSRRLVYVLGGAIGLMILVTVIFILRSFGSQQSADVPIEVWGVYDDSSAFSQAIADFQKLNSGMRVRYTLISPEVYEAQLLDALAAGTGPDVFMIQNTWLPKQINKLLSFPATFPGMKDSLFTLRQFESLFVDVAESDFVSNGKMYALPLYVDTLALYYNKDMFASTGIAQPPKTWSEFMADVKLLTRLDESRNIIQSGAAVGSARNINRSMDILMMLMLQSGVQMTSPTNNEATFSKSVDSQMVGERSLMFYTDFTNPQKEVYTWNDTQHYSIDAFIAGETAMMLNYSHQIPVLRQKAPRLNFAIAPAPQASVNDRRTYGSYWGLAVSQASKYPHEAWRFAHYMTAGAGNVSYLDAAGRPAGRRDLIDQQKNDPDFGVFAEQSLTARSWYQTEPKAIETIFADMIDSVNLGRQSVVNALKEAEAKVSVLMSRR